MAISASIKNRMIEISGIETANLNWSDLCTSENWDSFTAGIKAARIAFTPGAAGDVLYIREGSLTGPRHPKLESLSGEARNLPLDGKKCQPYIDYDETGQSLSAGAYITIYIVG